MWTYLGDFGLFGGSNLDGDLGELFWLGINKSTGGVPQSSHDWCCIFGALGLAGGGVRQDIFSQFIFTHYLFIN